jgi:hypothetical protein
MCRYVNVSFPEKCRIPTPNDSIVAEIKLKAEENICTASMMLFDIIKNYINQGCRFTQGLLSCVISEPSSTCRCCPTHSSLRRDVITGRKVKVKLSLCLTN